MLSGVLPTVKDSRVPRRGSFIALPEIAAVLESSPMLVLTRKISEVIKLGDDITLTVVRASNGSVQLGIQAPRSIRIMRAECENASYCPQVESKGV
jgi:carbon storage regulator CsrA